PAGGGAGGSGHGGAVGGSGVRSAGAGGRGGGGGAALTGDCGSRGPRLSWAERSATMPRRGIQPAKTLAHDLVQETLRRWRRGREGGLLQGRDLATPGRALP